MNDPNRGPASFESIELQQPPLLEPAGPVDLESLDSLTPKALDALPFGVIGLDATGKIFRYNRAEARLARIDQRMVVGKHFFREVAPCTSTAEFEGRFRDFVEAGLQQPLRFGYLFDFPFGAQEVEVELVPARAPGRFYLCVNRRKFYLASEKQPVGSIAPAQDELWPGEAGLGVQRDPRQDRAVSVGPAFFGSLASAWEAIAPRGWSLFCEHWGTEWGKLAVVDLEGEVHEQRDCTLRDLPRPEALERVFDYLSRQGWGHLEVDLAGASEGAFSLTFERNALAEAVGLSEVPRCALLSGFFRAVLGHIGGEGILVREICCQAQGHPSCGFIVAGEHRKEALEAAVGHAGDDLAGVLAAVRG